MTIEKATYSYSKVYQACELVKALNIDCKRKAEHFSIASQIKEPAPTGTQARRGFSQNGG